MELVISDWLGLQGHATVPSAHAEHATSVCVGFRNLNAFEPYINTLLSYDKNIVTYTYSF